MYINTSLEEVRKMKGKANNKREMNLVKTGEKVLKVVKPDFIVNSQRAVEYINSLTSDHKTLSRKRVRELEIQPQPAQRTEEWYKARETRITASEAACCVSKTKEICEEYVKLYSIKDFKMGDTVSANKYKTQDKFLIEKATSFYDRKSGIIKPYMSSDATRWGQKFEDSALRMYTLITGESVKEFGLICHKSLNWLGASPDGITDTGIMLEIKCPKSREITGVPPLHYYIQCQIQLECCDLEMCHFVECEMEEHTEEEWLKSDREHYGIIIEYQEGKREDVSESEDVFMDDAGIVGPFKEINWGERDPTESKYKYPPIKQMTKQELQDWLLVIRNSELEGIQHEPVYYTIKTYNIDSIKRSREWFETAKPILKSVHDKLEWLQQDEENLKRYKREISKEEIYEDCIL